MALKLKRNAVETAPPAAPIKLTATERAELARIEDGARAVLMRLASSRLRYLAEERALTEQVEQAQRALRARLIKACLAHGVDIEEAKGVWNYDRGAGEVRQQP